MARVTHFDIVAENPKRASEFYKKVFGWEFKKWDSPTDYWMIMTGDPKKPGIDGGMAKKSDVRASGVAANTIDVSDIDEVVEKIKKMGGKITSPKMAIPGVGWMAGFKDTEGNMMGLMEVDESAV